MAGRLPGPEMSREAVPRWRAGDAPTAVPILRSCVILRNMDGLRGAWAEIGDMSPALAPSPLGALRQQRRRC